MLVKTLRATPLDVGAALRVTWQLSGDPALTDLGVQPIATGLKLTSATAACGDALGRVAVMVALSCCPAALAQGLVRSAAHCSTRAECSARRQVRVPVT